MENFKPLNSEEILIIDTAIECARTFGLGIMTNVQEQLEDYGFEWSDRYEKLVFDRISLQ